MWSAQQLKAPSQTAHTEELILRGGGGGGRMSAVSQLWSAVKTGIILVLATRNEAKLASSGEFAIYFVSILALVLFIFTAQSKFLASTSPRFAQFDPLRQVVMTLVQLVMYYLIFVLAAGVQSWFQSNYMNGPNMVELGVTVGLIIGVLAVVGTKFMQYSSPKARHVEHLLKISELAVQINVHRQ